MQGILWGGMNGVTKANIRSLDYSSYGSSSETGGSWGL